MTAYFYKRISEELLPINLYYQTIRLSFQKIG